MSATTTVVLHYPAIMRTTTMDPLAEKYYDVGPYAWCGNNPVKLVDPDGRAYGDPESSGKPAEEKKNGVYSTAQSSIYIPEKKIVEPVKLTAEAKLNMMANSEEAKRNQGTLTQGKSNLERTMDILATPEDKQIATNPAVQITVVATIITVTAPVIVAEGGAAIIATEGRVVLSAASGAVEGITKSVTNAPPDTPYLINNPVYQSFSDIFNNATTILKDKK